MYFLILIIATILLLSLTQSIIWYVFLQLLVTILFLILFNFIKKNKIGNNDEAQIKLLCYFNILQFCLLNLIFYLNRFEVLHSSILWGFFSLIIVLLTFYLNYRISNFICKTASSYFDYELNTNIFFVSIYLFFPLGLWYIIPIVNRIYKSKLN